MIQIDFTALFTHREIHFEDSFNTRNRMHRATEQRATVPLIRVQHHPLFKTFVPVGRYWYSPHEYNADHIISLKENIPVLVHENLLRMSLTGRWSARKRSNGQLTIWVENDEDFVLLKLAGLFTNAQYIRVERDGDRERAKSRRDLNFTVLERRRLIKLLNRAIKDGAKLRSYTNRALDQKLLNKIL